MDAWVEEEQEEEEEEEEEKDGEREKKRRKGGDLAMRDAYAIIEGAFREWRREGAPTTTTRWSVWRALKDIMGRADGEDRMALVETLVDEEVVPLARSSLGVRRARKNDLTNSLVMIVSAVREVRNLRGELLRKYAEEVIGRGIDQRLVPAPHTLAVFSNAGKWMRDYAVLACVPAHRVTHSLHAVLPSLVGSSKYGPRLRKMSEHLERRAQSGNGAREDSHSQRKRPLDAEDEELEDWEEEEDDEEVDEVDDDGGHAILSNTKVQRSHVAFGVITRAFEEWKGQPLCQAPKTRWTTRLAVQRIEKKAEKIPLLEKLIDEDMLPLAQCVADGQATKDELSNSLLMILFMVREAGIRGLNLQNYTENILRKIKAYVGERLVMAASSFCAVVYAGKWMRDYPVLACLNVWVLASVSIVLDSIIASPDYGPRLRALCDEVQQRIQGREEVVAAPLVENRVGSDHVALEFTECAPPACTLRTLRLVREDEVEEDLLCALCLHPAIDPVMCKGGHMFCLECVTNRINSGATRCPVGGNSEPPLALNAMGQAPPFVKKVLRALEVHCTYAPWCEWQGTVARAAEHVKMCEWRRVLCASCKEGIAFRQRSAHSLTCAARMAACAFCQERVRASKMDAHHLVCKEGPLLQVECTACGVKMAQGELAKHVQKDAAHVVAAMKRDAKGKAAGVEKKEKKPQSAFLIAYQYGEEEFHVVWTFVLSGGRVLSDPFEYAGSQWHLEAASNGVLMDMFLCQPQQKVRDVRVSLKVTCHPTDELVEAGALLRFDQGDAVGWAQMIEAVQDGAYTVKVCLSLIHCID